MNEAEIIKGCLKNNRESQKVLYEYFYDTMLAVCLRYSNNMEEAKDILHNGFLKVFDNLKNFKVEGSFEGWIRRIMINTSIEYMRQKKQNYLIVSTVYANEKSTTTADDISDDTIIENLNCEGLLSALRALTPAYRTVFNLFIVDEYSHKEIADLLDISEDTSKSNLSKAKFNLRKNLAHSIKYTGNGK
jgi:RNA polymerase sigma-70 factor (ECF subfamily)